MIARIAFADTEGWTRIRMNTPEKIQAHKDELNRLLADAPGEAVTGNPRAVSGAD